jgi:hypothetical protein
MSTLSFSIEKHYCGEHLVDVSLFMEADKCGMESTDDDSALMDESCCKDVIDLVEGQDELSMENSELLNASQKVFLLSFTYVFGGLHIAPAEDDPPFEHYSPPEVIQDIQVLNEVFLI